MNATLYCRRPLSFTDIRDAAPGWQVAKAAGGEVLATLVSPKGRITLNSMPRSEISRHLEGLKGYVAANCSTFEDDFERRVDDTVQVVGWTIEAEDAESLDALIFALAQRGRAMLFDGESFISEERTLLAGPGEPQLVPPTAERVLHRL